MHSMFDVACNGQMISFFHFNQPAACEFQSRMAAQDDHPLLLHLIVPRSGRTAMGLRNDALDLDVAVFEQSEKLFPPSRSGQAGENIFRPRRAHQSPIALESRRSFFMAGALLLSFSSAMISAPNSQDGAHDEKRN
jgi:hypothetical protein